MFCFRRIFFFLFLFAAPFLSLAHAKEASFPQEVFAKYEQAVTSAQALNVDKTDVLHIKPKIHMSAQAMLQGRFEHAERLLDEALSDLKLLESQRTVHAAKSFRLHWLELYRDIMQKYAFLALFAFLFSATPYFRRMLRAGRWTAMGRVYWTILVVMAAVFFSYFDTTRYGTAAWAFFDIQVVFLVAGGLLGGLWSGLFAGLTVGAFRWVLKPDVLIYFFIAVAAGLIGALISLKLRSYRSTWKYSLMAGAAAGAVHGAAVYLPMAGFLPWRYITLSILFLVLLEGAAVFIFFAVISGILRHEHGREMEKELLKTRLLFLQAQISPHFLFNALNTIAAVCSRENAAGARGLVLSLAECFRRALKHDEGLITLREEAAYIDSYLALEKARYQERLNIVKNYDVDEPLWNLKIPFLILQPLVENAIKHGLSKKQEGGTLTVSFHKNGKDLVVEVADDGVGVDPARIKDILEGKIRQDEEVGIGLRNINERLIKSLGPEYALKFESRVSEGTHVTVRFPLKEKTGEGRS